MDGPDLNKPHTAASEACSVPPPFEGASSRPAAPARARPAGVAPGGRNYPSLHVLGGALAVLWGAAIILSKLFGVGGWSVHGNQAYEAGKEFATVVGAAMVVAGVFHVRRGARRYRGIPAPAVTGRNRLVNLGVTAALSLLVFLAAPLIPDPDKRFDNRRAPYSYRYPGDWTQQDVRELVGAYRWLQNVSLVARSDDDAGVIVSTYPSGKAAALQSDFTAQLERQGGRVVAQRVVTVIGRPAVFFAYDMPAGRHDGSMTIAHRPDADYIVWCQWENDPPSARQGCDKVRETLEVKRLRVE